MSLLCHIPCSSLNLDGKFLGAQDGKELSVQGAESLQIEAMRHFDATIDASKQLKAMRFVKVFFCELF